MLKIISFLLILLSFTLPSLTYAEILPAEKAFVPYAKVVNGNLVVQFDIEKEYYLYKNKISIKALDNTKLGMSSFSQSKIKKDDFFGEVDVFYQQAKITKPIEKAGETINFEVTSQGCWEGGVCYPPVKQKLTVLNKNTQAIQKPKNSFNTQKSNKENFLAALNTQNGLEDPVNIDIAFKLDAFKLDDSNIRLVWQIRDGYYLYNDKFSFDIAGAEFGEINFPEGEPKKDEFFGDIFVHKKELSVDVPIKNISGDVQLSIGYQGCWEGGVCYPPAKKTKTIKIKPVLQEVKTITTTQKVIKEKTNLVTQSQTSTKKVIDVAKIIAKKQQEDKLSEEEQVAQNFANSSFIWILVSFFGFGILAAFTSCILPMIPILSSLIIGTDNPTKKKAFFMSLTFVIFMALTYAVAGIFAGMFGANLQAVFQNPWIIISFSALFVVLAFSMFGYYEIKIPNFIQAKLTTISNKQKGGHLIGVAIMGVLSALIVGPCAAPVLSGALLYIGDSGDAVLGGSALFMMGLGMGLPLIIAGVGVATPRAGAWMDNVKAVFGVIMLGVAIFFLERILDENITIIMWAALLTIAPIALGVVGGLTDGSAISRVFKAIGLIILGFGIAIWIAIAKGYENIDIFAPLKTDSVAYSQNIQISKAEFKTIKTLEELNREIKNSTKPVMLDFYADWCVYCITYEKEVFTNPKVAKLLQNFTLLKADITDNNDKDIELLANFKIIAPPAILFFKDGVELRGNRVVGEKNAEEFFNILQKIN